MALCVLAYFLSQGDFDFIIRDPQGSSGGFRKSR